jgi:pyruvate ferredoxin oxidoreductase beta subunit
VIVRQILQVAGPNTVVVSGTGCLEVSTTRFPRTAWRLPWMHNAFENAAATMSGVEAAHRALAKQGGSPDERPNFIVFAGDGGTYDIGLQSLSGAIERGHRFLYVCLNNEAYMNTGIQRSSATPLGSWTTTSPVGSADLGKLEPRKDLTKIIAAHDIPFAAQASPHLWKDLMRKTERALAVDGPSFINVLSPCPRGWRSPPEAAIELGRIAANTCVWPIYEVDQGKWDLNYRPRKKLPISDWFQAQGRFSHLLEPENSPLLEKIQNRLDEDWQELLGRCGDESHAS